MKISGESQVCVEESKTINASLRCSLSCEERRAQTSVIQGLNRKGVIGRRLRKTC